MYKNEVSLIVGLAHPLLGDYRLFYEFKKGLRQVKGRRARWDLTPAPDYPRQTSNSGPLFRPYDALLTEPLAPCETRRKNFSHSMFYRQEQTEG